MTQYVFHTITLDLGSWVYHRGTKRRGDGPCGQAMASPVMGTLKPSYGWDDTSKIGYFSLGEEKKSGKPRKQSKLSPVCQLWGIGRGREPPEHSGKTEILKKMSSALKKLINL